MTVFAIRWASRINGEEESGILKTGYVNEEDAKKAMMKDAEDIRKDWETGGTSVKTMQGAIGNYYGIWVEDDTYDYYEWYIEKLVV